jgi:hypothetical protein
MLRIFVILDGGEFGRPDGQTSVVADDFQSSERTDPLSLQFLQDRSFAEKIKGVPYGDIPPIRKTQVFWVILCFSFGHLEAVVAGDTRDQQFPITLLRKDQVSGRKSQR